MEKAKPEASRSSEESPKMAFSSRCLEEEAAIRWEVYLWPFLLEEERLVVAMALSLPTLRENV